jgi:cysteine desulfurase
MRERIYLDNNAGTLVAQPVIAAIVEHLQKIPGNPSSLHSFGQEARAVLNKGRSTIAEFLHVKPKEIIFTSGGTESLNMVLFGLFAENPQGHIITSNVDHSAVYSTCKYLETRGCRVTYLQPDLGGVIKPEEVRESIQSDTRLITLMGVNNETGIKTDIDAMARIAKDAKIPFLVDAIAWFGKERFVIPDGVSAMAFSGYKCHGPKGIGFAYILQSLKITPLLMGGEQEFLRRGGTENLPGIVGLTAAVQLLNEHLPEATHRMAALRDHLEKSLMERLSGVTVNGQGSRICNTTNLSFKNVEGETLLAKLDLAGLAVSHGSACASGALEPSRVLLNMGIPKKVAASAIRFSLSHLTTPEEIDDAIDIVIKTVEALRR